MQSWQLSPYPAGKRFAFTLVHDADGAYSRRLAPLFDIFDCLGLRLTVTLFPLWAKWAHAGGIWDEWRALGTPEQLWAPGAVPLEDDRERDFYLRLAAAGHEMAMHSGSETSDTREALLRAFDLFEQVFGHGPKAYVEHSSGNNLDTQRQQGSKAGSPYFNNDLLQQRCRWVWLDDERGLGHQKHPRFYDLRACGGPFRAAGESYGLANAFQRSGRWGRGTGDGFLEVYTQERILELESTGGLALVYTHLQQGWLDRMTGQMCQKLRSRLEFLASRKGWFAPAGEILDRLQAMELVRLEDSGVRNEGSHTVKGLTLMSPGGGWRVLGDLGPGEAMTYPSG